MGYLTLENGDCFEGRLFGSKEEIIGEVVFNTGMTGYEDILADSAYQGQIVTMTYPLIGNYGINHQDMGHFTPYLGGFIVREVCQLPSNWRLEKTLEEFCIENNIVGLQGIDTRNLTKILVQSGVIKGLITQSLPTKTQLKKLKEYSYNSNLRAVSTKREYHITGDCHKVAVIDYGLNKDFLKGLEHRKLDITVLPYNTTEDRILNNFDGVILSNGPGDPSEHKECILTTQKLLGRIPMFGFGLGHQLIGLASRGSIKKLKFGHRGSNVPIKCLATNKMYITYQNHSYIIDKPSNDAEVILINWNDNTIAGLKYKSLKALSVQFYPELSTGPSDASYIIDDFLGMIKDNKDD